ncbi:MAG: extracellular solute-binding protein [bacterium]
MQNTSTVQYVIIGIFVVFIVIGIVIFAGFTGNSNSGSGGSVQVSVWGVIPESAINNAVDKINTKAAGTVNISYKQHPLATFDNDLANAIAQGSGPDLVILPESNLLKDNKLFVTIPYTAIPQRTFQDTFASPASIFLTSKGITALPIIIDPLVLYWNKDIFATAGVPTPPSTWKDLTDLVPKLSNITTGKTILQSAISFGEYQNVKNAKEILLTLFFQAGNPIIQLQNDNLINITYSGGSGDNQANLVESALSFYTQFANPSSVAYSWNRSLSNSDDMFLRGKSATYVGYASEYPTLSSQNPNLNFDVSVIPQASGTTNSVTYAKVYGVAIVNASKNQQSALTNAEALVSSDFMGYFTDETGLPSVRISQLSAQNSNSAGEIFRRSILIGKDWLDPDPNSTNNYFQAMIESVDNGSSNVSDAVRTFDLQIKELLK